MSFFETIAIHGERGIFVDEHLARLARAVGSVGGVIKHDDLLTLVAELVMGLEDGVLRIYATAGPGAFGDVFSGEIFAIYESVARPVERPPARLVTYAAPYAPRPGGWKSGNYWQNVDALQFAHDAGCEEALLFDSRGCLVSAAMANVFLCIDERWVTPRLGEGTRDGVVRAWVRERFACEEECLGFSDVVRCSAGFVTNSRVGVRMIAEVDGRPLGRGPAWGEIYRKEVLGD